MLTLVPTPIGNISDISHRALSVLGDAEILLCEDTRVTKKLLNLLKERYQLETTIEKFISIHAHNEYHFIQNIKEKEPDFFDKKVVYLSDAGMPGISDPGQYLVQYCLANGIEYDVLPGANAVLTAYVASGFTQTQMLFFGFLPHKGKERKEALLKALYNGFTTVLYEAPHRLLKTLDEIDVEDSSRKVFAAKELTKKYQSYFVGTASELKEQLYEKFLKGNKGASIKGEWVLVVEAAQARHSTIGEQDILALDLPKKAAAKLISKVTGENTKACYERLMKTN
jgi:16S rRNA (cytidine1402-2'-O)-methyltransferase